MHETLFPVRPFQDLSRYERCHSRHSLYDRVMYHQYNFFGKKKIIHMCDVICKMVGVLGLNRWNTYWLEEPQLCHNELIGP